jgi:restriction system protein
MSRYWVVAPYSAEDNFYKEVLEFDLNNGVISIGWHSLGDVVKISKSRLRELYEQQNPSSPSATVTRTVNMIWNFYNEIEMGDIIIARRGTKTLAAVGVVQKKAYFDEAKGKVLSRKSPDFKHCSWLDVKWQDAPRNKEYDDQTVFGIQTIYEIDETEYEALVEKVTPVEMEIYENIPDRQQFYLEEHLEQYIVDNFPAILGPQLELLKDEEANIIGRQYRLSNNIGRIDILAYEPESDSYVVVELKKGRESDKVVGQILRYMGWIGDELCTDGQQVRGIIILGEPDDKLTYAVKATQNIEIKYYQVELKLSDKHN